MDFQAFVNDIKINHWNVYGAEVYKQGEQVHSFGDTEDSRHSIYSATKTVLSIVVGIACDEGKFDIKKSILHYLPQKTLASMPEKQIAIFKDITIERLLTMSVGGFPFRPEGESYLQYALSCELTNVQEREFNYSNISAYLVGVALTHAVGEDLYAYMERKLFTPLHIIDPVYKRCPDGYFYGASGMELTVHELSKFGLLLYHGGIYEGQRIVSEVYVKQATGIRQMNREGGYGYFIWKYRDGFSINGKWKQKCYVLPKEEIIVTFLSHIEGETIDLRESMERHILESRL